MFGLGHKTALPSKEDALPGRPEAIQPPAAHFVSGNPLAGPFAEGLQTAIFGMGCFWGAERRFWQLPGVYATAVGYAGGFTPNPTYEEVCTGMTGHAEVVRVVFDPALIDYQALLKAFWEGHDPTQVMRQGNDVGPSTVRPSTPSMRRNGRRRALLAITISMPCSRPPARQSLQRSCRRLASILPRPIISSTWPSIQPVTAGLAVPASPTRNSELKGLMTLA
jgi:hypothetical protein